MDNASHKSFAVLRSSSINKRGKERAEVPRNRIIVLFAFVDFANHSLWRVAGVVAGASDKPINFRSSRCKKALTRRFQCMPSDGFERLGILLSREELMLMWDIGVCMFRAVGSCEDNVEYAETAVVIAE